LKAGLDPNVCTSKKPASESRRCVENNCHPNIPIRSYDQRREAAPDAESNSKWENGAIDRATGAEFRERSFDSIVDRWETSWDDSAEPALWRVNFGWSSYRFGPDTAQHGSAPADLVRADCKSGAGLYLHRDLGFGPTGVGPEHLLHPNNASWRNEKEEKEVLVLVTVVENAEN
jgi:hypothetical protein